MSSMGLHCHGTAIGVYKKRRAGAFSFFKQFLCLPHMLTCAFLRLRTLYLFERLFWGKYLKNFRQHEETLKRGRVSDRALRFVYSKQANGKSITLLM